MTLPAVNRNRPNLLFLMTDQMQGCVLAPDHICQTPNFDRLQARGVRFTHAYTPNAICSPARASLMTGLLPHNHNVWTVTHTVRNDRAVMRSSPHWAEYLDAAGYRTGYFGKWHVERSHDLARYGWQEALTEGHREVQASQESIRQQVDQGHWQLEGYLDTIPGYSASRFYGVTEVEPAGRGHGLHVRHASRFLDSALQQDIPWACFVSVLEPHDPFVCGEEAFTRYDVNHMPLPASLQDDFTGRPEIYRRAQRPWHNWSTRQHQEATACYYASISEIDQLFGQLLDRIEAAGQLDSTLVVLTSDHGELLGAHGLYCKNYTAAEEIYRVPMVLAGPGIQEEAASNVRVGLHDLYPTLLDLLDLEHDPIPDSRSFADILDRGASTTADPRLGYAEYEGTRFQLTQRIVWDDPWKFVFNGFAQDELYHLEQDPYEMQNLITDPDCKDQTEHMTRTMWDFIRRTGDHTLLQSQYPILRLASVGPDTA